MGVRLVVARWWWGTFQLPRNSGALDLKSGTECKVPLRLGSPWHHHTSGLFRCNWENMSRSNNEVGDDLLSVPPHDQNPLMRRCWSASCGSRPVGQNMNAGNIDGLGKDSLSCSTGEISTHHLFPLEQAMVKESTLPSCVGVKVALPAILQAKDPSLHYVSHFSSGGRESLRGVASGRV